jgi:hypothetical protein
MRYGLLPTGFICCGDGSGDNFLLSSEEDQVAALNIAIRELLSARWIHAVLLKSRHGDQISRHEHASSRESVRDLRRELLLPGSFETFLGTLGYRTRRNFRHYRRRAESARWTFHSGLDEQSFAAGVLGMQGCQQFAKSRRYLEKCLAFVDAPGSLRIGLRTPEGQWVGLAGGRIEGARLYLLFQLNHSGYLPWSVSTVLRSLLIEYAVSRGVDRIVFLDGCGGALRPYCVPEQCRITLIEKQNLLAGVARAARELIFRTPPPAAAST